MKERALAALLLSLPLSLVAEWLVKHTHHRPLGAATFAALSVSSFVAVTLLLVRARGLSSYEMGSYEMGSRAKWARALWALGVSSALGASWLAAFGRAAG